MATRTLSTMALALLCLAPLAACANMGSILTGRPDDLYGEVRTLDTRRGYLGIREDYGRDFTVRYDAQTRVTYGGRSYPVSSLRRGDLVQVRIQYDRNDEPWADRIELRRDPRSGGTDRADRSGMRVERWDGTVQQVDWRAGWFVLDRNRSGDVRVYLGRDTRREDARRFERLRRGERVRVEVRRSLFGQAELVRFR